MTDEQQDRPGGKEPSQGSGPDGRSGDNGSDAAADRPRQGGPDQGKSDPPRGGKPYGSRPPDRRGGGRPYGFKSGGGRPYGDRPQGGRPYGSKPGGGRPYGDRPQGGRSYGDRPPNRGPGGGPSRGRPDDDRGPRPGGYSDSPRGPGPRPPGRDRRVEYGQVERRSGPRPPRGPWDRDRGPRRPGGDWGRPDRSGPPRPPIGPAPVDVLSEDEEIVAGRRPVEEAFAARREVKRMLVVPERRAALDQLVLHATTLRIPVVEVEGGTITSVSGFDGHQGVALVVAPRRWATLDDVLALAKSRAEPPFLLALDHLEDPQNVGTLLRSAEACGVHGVVFPTRGAAPISPAAIKTSAGAVEHLLLVPLEDLATGLVDLHAQGIRVIGADGGASMTVREADLRGPIVIVTGSEGRGLHAKVRRRVDLMARIPMRGKVASLNASVAGSIFLFEAAAQRDLPEAELAPDEPGSEVEAPDLGADAPLLEGEATEVLPQLDSDAMEVTADESTGSPLEDSVDEAARDAIATGEPEPAAGDAELVDAPAADPDDLLPEAPPK